MARKKEERMEMDKENEEEEERGKIINTSGQKETSA